MALSRVMSRPPLVSVLIPAYRAAPWIAKTIESALAQTHRPIEVIVVDDGSPDETGEVARTVAVGQPGIVHVYAQSNSGASSARNHALRLSRGEYVQYLDADDLLHPQKIARQLALAATSVGSGRLLSGEWGRFYGDDLERTEFRPDELWTDLDAASWQMLALAGNLMVHPAAWLVPRKLADAAGPWDERLTLNDDGEYFARLRFLSGHIPFCAGARSYYRSGLAGSLSSPNSRRALESAFLSHQLIHSLLLRHRDDRQARSACAKAWLHFAYAASPISEELAFAAELEAKRLGGAQVAPPGGRIFQLAVRLLGRRAAFSLRGRLKSTSSR